MCGIAGFLTAQPADPDLLARMCEVIGHRGPDDDGFLVEGGLGLGMRRLAIIDLDSGRQPIWNEDETIAVVFNGEIYNHRQLRAELEAAGHRFRTRTDTECLVHLYESEGVSFVRRLRGMFAIALWDRPRGRLVLARDRVGKKPLVYRVDERGIWFASELKSLLQDPAVQRTVDRVALHHYLTYQYVPAPWTIFDGIRKLPPATTLVYESGKVTLDRYWRLSYEPKWNGDERTALEELHELLVDSTRVRLMSDRPLGAFLSGGLDSSLVVAAMSDIATGPVKTFSIGFDERQFDERAYARLVAERFGTEHHELVVSPRAAEILPELVWHYDEPYADSSAVPSFYLARMTREQVVVALNGDGGDESFGGYARYAAALQARRFGLSSAPTRRAAAWLHRRLPDGERGTLYGKAKRFAGVLAKEDARRYASLISYFDTEEKCRLYTPAMRAAVEAVDSYELIDRSLDEPDACNFADRLLRLDVETYLPGDLLVKMDIATMASSLEARSPFLDHHLMEFAASLPSAWKI
ncbi:MAG TPA: asparagine synthase (glutamine-hydrolyzing), partial [Acidimicrobiia bacterium]|nr:asparagine synthase (glutamine-hydrolyzing) [Acidimicrobiia bacterium]